MVMRTGGASQALATGSSPTFAGLTLTGGLAQGVSTITATGPTALTTANAIVFADATSNNVTLTLPAANASGASESVSIVVIRKDNGANTVTVQRAGADTLLGGATSTTLSGNSSKRFNSDGVSLWSLG